MPTRPQRRARQHQAHRADHDQQADGETTHGRPSPRSAQHRPAGQTLHHPERALQLVDRALGLAARRVRRTRANRRVGAAVAADGVGALHRRTYRRAPAGPTTRAVGRGAVQCAARRPVGHLLNAGADRPGGRCVELYAARPCVIRTCLPPRCSFRSYRVMSCWPMLSRGRVAPSPRAQVHRLEVSGPGLIDCQGVTHADGVAFPQSLQFLDDSAMKSGCRNPSTPNWTGPIATSVISLRRTVAVCRVVARQRTSRAPSLITPIAGCLTQDG
jgi:hypothetical protein